MGERKCETYPNKQKLFFFCFLFFWGGGGIFPLKALKKNTVARFHRE